MKTKVPLGRKGDALSKPHVIGHSQNAGTLKIYCVKLPSCNVYLVYMKHK